MRRHVLSLLQSYFDLFWTTKRLTDSFRFFKLLSRIRRTENSLGTQRKATKGVSQGSRVILNGTLLFFHDGVHTNLLNQATARGMQFALMAS